MRNFFAFDPPGWIRYSDGPGGLIRSSWRIDHNCSARTSVYEQPPRARSTGYHMDAGLLGVWSPRVTTGSPGFGCIPPQVGMLWTPAYWGFAGGFYGFHPGYWGPHVGFYGGINYGYGYGGVGYAGGAWRGEHFAYNTEVTRVNSSVIYSTYNERVIVNGENHASFNGPGGMSARPGPQEEMAAREHHFQPTGNQFSHESAARADRGQLASVNHGRPGNVAMARPMTPGTVNHTANGPVGHTPSGGAPVNHTPSAGAPVNHTPPNAGAPVNHNVNNYNRPPQGNAGPPPQGNAGQPHASGPPANGGAPPSRSGGQPQQHTPPAHGSESTKARRNKKSAPDSLTVAARKRSGADFL